MGFTAEQRSLFASNYKKLESQSDDKIVLLIDKMLQLMIDAGEAQVKHIHSKSVVPHKANRDGALMLARKMYQKGSKILGVGFSLNKCDPRRAVAFQSKVASDVSRFLDHANPNPHFATFDKDMVEAGSVGCGHLNQFLAAIFDEVEVPPEFTSPDCHLCQFGHTKFNKRHICENGGKDLELALDKGLQWTWIPYKFEAEFPKFPHFIQKALNIEHHIGEGETWDSQLGAVAQAIVDHYKGPLGSASQAPDFNKITKSILQSKPPRALDVLSHVSFCKKWGGGKTQKFTLDICKYINMKGKSKIVNGPLFDALTAINMPSDSVCPYFVAAVIKCASIQGAGRNGISIHISENDGKSLMTKLATVKEANAFMEKAACVDREFCNGTATEARGDMECKLVDYVLYKLPKAQRDKTSMNEICMTFIKTVSKTEDDPEPKSAQHDEAVQDHGIFDPSMNVVKQTLKNLGWSVGSIIAEKVRDPKHPTADTEYEIGYINEDGDIGLYHIDADGTTLTDKLKLVSQVDLTAKYTVLGNDLRSSKIEVCSTPTQNVHTSLFSSIALIGVQHAFHTKNKVPEGSIYIQKLPSMKVIAERQLKPGTAVFAPWASLVSQWKDDKAAAFVTHPDHEITQPMALLGTDDWRTVLAGFNITKPADAANVVTFWNLRKVSDKDNSNMHLEWTNVNVPIPKIGGINKTMMVKVCVAVISKTIEPTDELVMYVPSVKVQKEPKRAINAVSEPADKKARI